MCGIAGVITSEKGKGTIDRRNFMEQAFMYNTLRGFDATGTFYVKYSKPEQAGWYKKCVNGFEFLDDETVEEIGKNAHELMYWVGHNRAATVGKKTVENAHPFQEGPITLVHNGTLDSTYELPQTLYETNEKRETTDRIEVDSHLIAHNLANHPLDEVIGAIRGAFALVWHDARDGTLNIIRNDRRPLALAASKEDKSVYFMSEAAQLYSICDRTKIKIGKLYTPEPGALLTFKPGSIRPLTRKVPLLVPTKKTYQSFGFAPSGGRGYGPFGVRNSNTGGGTTRNTGGGSYIDADMVHVGGKMRAVPDTAQNMLLEANLVVEDRILMKPIQYVPNIGRPGWGTVIGQANHKEAGGITCCIHDVEQTTWNTFGRAPWAVRPIGLNYQHEKTFLVLCKTVTMRENACGLVAQYNAVDTTKDLVPGPNHTRIPLSEFRKLVEDGCFSCGDKAAVGPAYASSIRWVNDFKKPVCAGCQLDAVNFLGDGL